MRHVLAFLLLCLPTLLPATDYYVATTGNDTNPGTLASPWLTFQRAVNIVTAGDTVYFAAGTYDSTVSWAQGGSGTSGNPIIFDGQGVATVAQLRISKPYVTIRNFTFFGDISGAGGFSGQLHVLRNAHHLHIHDCVFDKNFQYTSQSTKHRGIEWEGPEVMPFGSGEVASDCIIEDCEFTRYKGIYAASIYGDRNIFRNNEIHDIAQGDCIWLFGRENLVQGNICHNSYEFIGVGFHADFIQCLAVQRQGSKDHIINGNFVYDFQDAVAFGQMEGDTRGVAFNEVKDWTFRNNIFTNIGSGLSCSVPGMKFYNNLFYRVANVQSNPISLGSRAYTGGGTNYATGAILKNNIFIDCGPPDNVGAFAYGFTSVDSFTDSYADYNFVAKTNFQPVRADEYQRWVGDETSDFTITGVAATNVITTSAAHNLSPNWHVRILTITGGTGLTALTNYYIETVPSPTSFTLRTGAGLGQLDFTTDITAGTAQMGVDSQRFYEPNGINGGSPGFLNATQSTTPGDYHITEDSPLIGVAEQNNAIFTTDYDGITRGASWDIGPYEYEPPGVPVPPDMPTGLAVAATSQSRILATWNDVSADETGFNIYRSLVSGSGFELAATVAADVESYASTGLTPNTAYYFKISSFNDAGESSQTVEQTATTRPAPDTAPAVGRKAGARTMIFRR
jgi:hypothetical protein